MGSGAATPARWQHWIAKGAEAGRQRPGLPGERQWRHGSQPALAHAMSLRPHTPADRAHTRRSCARFLRSQQQRLGSSAGSEVVAGLSSNRNATWPLWMLELPVAATGGDQHPARLLQGFDHLPDLHANGLDSSHSHCLLMGAWPASVQSRKPAKEGKS